MRIQVSSGPVEDPFASRHGVLGDLLGPEPEGDLALGRLWAVAAVHEVVLLADREVPAYGSGSRGDAAGGTEHAPNDADRLVSPQHADDDRAAGDERDQAFEERLALVLGIVLLPERSIDPDQLECCNSQSLAFKSCQDLTNQPALNTVGLEDNQGTLHAREPMSDRGRRLDGESCNPRPLFRDSYPVSPSEKSV